jgi:LPXTG-motif cell wall-anchored protein
MMSWMLATLRLMRVRALTAAVAAALLLPAAALGQSAGDDQYQDPFDGSGTPAAGSSGSSNGLSQTPDLAGSSGSGTAGTGSSGNDVLAGDVPASSSASQLPATGADAHVLALAGLALLLGGLGLRLRTADERF